MKWYRTIIAPVDEISTRMDKWENIVEKRIQEARSQGAFDNLEGAGSPIDLNHDPFEPADLRMAHRLLRNNGFAPPWIEEAKDLKVAKGKACAELARAWERYRSKKSTRSGQECWTTALNTFRWEVHSLNQRALVYNLKAPSIQVHIQPLDADREIERTTRQTSCSTESGALGP